MRAFFFACALALGACGAPSPETNAAGQPESVAAPAVDVRDAWAAPTPGGVEVAAGYLTLTNTTMTTDRLVAIETPRAERVEVHEMTMVDGVMQMRPVEGGLSIDPGQMLTLAPGGLHLMFYGVTQPFVEGENVPVRFTFEHAGAVQAAMPVRRPGSAQSEHSGHDGH